MIKNACFMICACFFFAASAAHAASPVQGNDIPTRITSDDMTYDADARQVTFNTNVHVTRPDFEMWSNKMVVFLKPAEKKGDGSVAEGLAAGDIDYIIATGNVRMKRDKNSSVSEKATYTMDNALLILEGNPRLTDGENTITGDVVRYFMNENRSDVKSKPGRQVEAVFSTSGSGREGGR